MQHLTRKEKKIIKYLKDSLSIISAVLSREVFRRAVNDDICYNNQAEQYSRILYIVSLTLLRLKRLEDAKRKRGNDEEQ